VQILSGFDRTAWRILLLPLALLVPVVGGSLLYAVISLVAALGQGYGWSDMDWNQDGSTSIGEVLDSKDVGTSEVVKEGKQCVEYWSYKDGLPIKTVCPQR
jgi:hypothetical protein